MAAAGGGIADAEDGKIGTIIVKDMSRFGRDYLNVGMYTEMRFPEMGVRFIAVSDGVDSDEASTNDFTPFRNIMNEWYCRDISKKIRTSLTAKAQAGKHINARVPYGYMRAPDDHQQWLVDEEAAEVVREIFRLFINGMSAGQICAHLNESAVESPVQHMHRIGMISRKEYESKANSEFPNRWVTYTVLHIIDRYEYCGHTVSNRTVKRSYKSKKRTHMPEEDWIITRDTQEPIIDEETWQRAHQIRLSGRRTRHDRDKGPLNGRLFCMDCGSKLYFHYRPGLLYRPGFFNCGRYQLYHACTIHYVKMYSIEQIVLEQIQRCCRMAQEDEKAFAAMLKKKLNAQDDASRRKDERELADSQNRLTGIDRIIEQLYEDRVTGTLTTERFTQMLARYEDEQQSLRGKCDTLRQTLASKREEAEGVEQFMKMVQSVTKPTELTPELVGALIDRVEVGDVYEVNGEKKQDIRILFNFIGEIG